MSLQCILIFASFLFFNDESDISKFVSQDEVFISIIAAVCNGSLTFLKIYLEGHAVDETFIEYALNCVMGRVEWLPFEKKFVSFVGPKVVLMMVLKEKYLSKFHILHTYQ